MHLRKKLLAATGVITLAAAPAVALTAGTADASSDVVVNVNPPHVSAAAAGLGPLSSTLTPRDCLRQTGAFACQTPDSIRAAYNIPTTVNGQLAGTGQRIVIVDAFGSPTMQSDLDTFDARFGLPATTVKVYYPGGTPAFTGTPNQLGWAEETSLDVQWAHAVAPGATIDLVAANTNYGSALNNAEQYAVDNHLGNVMSMSFGSPESSITSGNNAQQQQSHAIYVQAQSEGITVLASSGDSGSDNGAGYANFGYPASDPLVTAVGGTNLYTNSGVHAPNETVWGDFDPTNCPLCGTYGPFGATGGAPSTFTGKVGSDIAYNASVYTGVLTYLGFLGGSGNGFYFFGGTSAGSPQWAGVVAILDQAQGHALGFLNDTFQSWAKLGYLNDVTSGSNITLTFGGGFSAGKGYDAPTGWGTPDVGKLISAVSPSAR